MEWLAESRQDGQAARITRFRVQEFEEKYLSQATHLYLPLFPNSNDEWTGKILRDKKLTNVVLLADGEVVGLYSFDNRRTYFGFGRPRKYLEALIVDERYRGTGAADVLFEDMVERIAGGNRETVITTKIVRDPSRANRQGKVKGTFDEIKSAFGIQSIVNLQPASKQQSAGARLATKEQVRKEAGVVGGIAGLSTILLLSALSYGYGAAVFAVIGIVTNVLGFRMFREGRRYLGGALALLAAFDLVVAYTQFKAAGKTTERAELVQERPAATASRPLLFNVLTGVQKELNSGDRSPLIREQMAVFLPERGGKFIFSEGDEIHFSALQAGQCVAVIGYAADIGTAFAHFAPMGPQTRESYLDPTQIMHGGKRDLSRIIRRLASD